MVVGVWWKKTQGELSAAKDSKCINNIDCDANDEQKPHKEGEVFAVVESCCKKSTYSDNTVDNRKTDVGNETEFMSKHKLSTDNNGGWGVVKESQAEISAVNEPYKLKFSNDNNGGNAGCVMVGESHSQGKVSVVG